jgi:hypothetical protein
MAGPASASESATAPANPTFVIIILLSARGAINCVPAGDDLSSEKPRSLRNTACNHRLCERRTAPGNSRSNAQNRKQGFSVFLKFHLCKGDDGATAEALAARVIDRCARC